MIRCHESVGAIFIVALVAVAICLGDETESNGSANAFGIQELTTPDGTKYFAIDNQPKSPAPTLLILAWDGNATLSYPDFVQCGRILAKDGYLCVSVDLPGHGAERRESEPEGLAAWRVRLDQGEDPIGELSSRSKRVLDHLIASGQSDERRIAICGISRGGFAALRVAAAEPRAKCVAVFAPVTDLGVLTEFEGADKGMLNSQSLDTRAAELANRPVWIIVGDHDDRISTDKVIEFSRKLTASAISQKVEPQAELHVCPAPGHATPKRAGAESANWVSAILSADK